MTLPRDEHDVRATDDLAALVARVVDVHVVGRGAERVPSRSGRRRRCRRRSRRPRRPCGTGRTCRAGAVEISSTQRLAVILPHTTPPSWIRSTRFSTPGRPLGIFRKSPRPSSFWPSKSNGQWSVPTSCRSSLTRPFQSSSWCPAPASRSGGEHTNLAPSNPWPRSSSDRNRYCGHVSAKTGWPSSRARRTASSASLRGHVDEVDRRPGRLREPDHPVGRLALEDRVAGETVADRVGRALRDEVGGDHVDDRAVLGVHQDQPAVAGRLPQRLEDRGVVAQEDARIGGEQLERRDAVVDELVHLGQEVVPHVRDDAVEAVVDAGLAVGLLVPGVEALARACRRAAGRRSR